MNPEIIELGQLCYSRRSCHDTHFATFGAFEAKGEWRRDVYVVVRGDGAYLITQWSFSGNVKRNCFYARCNNTELNCCCNEWENKKHCLECVKQLLDMPCEWAKELAKKWVSHMPTHAREYVKLMLGL